ncbi:hypothetical protein B0T16DRAFT_220489 [Cercophora newfieldiana]|uniref:Transmembrane protein n=1 Tax=Cercophora newfieldiana TaxID=92897 RepID=A0AA40CLV7_9PEZI|nr:hypothetical protein B0T16DRAFT_220489 [Cercophora newfieldiana]
MVEATNDKMCLLPTVVPEWWVPSIPSQSDVILSSWLWGFTMSLAVFSGSKGFEQTRRSWSRSHKVNAYILMIWLVWVTDVILSAICWLYIMDKILPSIWYFLGMLAIWTIQIQCLTQILANRISFILYDPEKSRRLKLSVALIMGLINVTVFIVWIPARLQISEAWIKANNIWDRVEKCIFLIVDAALNLYFMRLVKSKLIANGLHKYKRVYRFNGLLVCVSIAIDITIIGIMSLPDDTLYIQAHALGYMMKLNIEMNLADLIGKVVKKASQERTDFPEARTWPSSPTREAFKRELQGTLKKWRLVCPRQQECHTRNGGSPERWGERGAEQEKVTPSWPAPAMCPFRKGGLTASVQPIKSHSPSGRHTEVMVRSLSEDLENSAH